MTAKQMALYTPTTAAERAAVKAAVEQINVAINRAKAQLKRIDRTATGEREAEDRIWNTYVIPVLTRHRATGASDTATREQIWAACNR